MELSILRHLKCLLLFPSQKWINFLYRSSMRLLLPESLTIIYILFNRRVKVDVIFITIIILLISHILSFLYDYIQLIIANLLMHLWLSYLIDLLNYNPSLQPFLKFIFLALSFQILFRFNQELVHFSVCCVYFWVIVLAMTNQIEERCEEKGQAKVYQQIF